MADITCEFCGHKFDEECGRYGCPNCLGEGLDSSGVHPAPTKWDEYFAAQRDKHIEHLSQLLNVSILEGLMTRTKADEALALTRAWLYPELAPPDDDDEYPPRCTSEGGRHDWDWSSGYDPDTDHETRMYCLNCGADGDA